MARATPFLTTLALIGNVEAYWRMPCGIIQTGRIDPIINPGTVSGHVHKISGPPNINPSSSYESLQENRCTSCQIQADKSGYWTPLLYYRHSNGSFEEVPASGMTVYYLGRGENASYIQPFPKGFRMLSGNPLVRAYDNSTYTYGGQQGVVYTGGHCQTGDLTCVGGKFVPRSGTSTDPPGPVFTGRPVSDRVSFNCLDQAGPLPETSSMSSVSCSDGLRAQIQFPSCWDGQNLYLTDNSHVDYLSQIDNGVCPPSHPVLLPHLFYEVLYGVTNVQSDGGEFVFAMGDPTGFGFHGDFLNGWDLDVLQQAIQSCINVDNGGGVDQCAAFTPSLDYNSGYNCPEQPPYFDEAVRGMIGNKLPGCNPIVSGPNPATYGDISCPLNTTSPEANTTYQYGSGSSPTNPKVGSVMNGYTYVGCFADDSAHSFAKASTQTAGMTNEACQAFCNSKNMPLAATEYGRQCFCGYSLDPTINTPGSCNSMICAGNSSEYCGGGLSLNVWNSTIYTGSYDPTLPVPGASVGNGIEYLGCASEATTGRALSVQSTTSQTNMTNQLCASFCQSQGLSLFGTEYGSECYCGNSFAVGSQLNQTGCNMGCSGNAPTAGPFASWANICGGPNRLTVWNMTASYSAAAASSARLSTKSAASSTTATLSSPASSKSTGFTSTSLSPSSSKTATLQTTSKPSATLSSSSTSAISTARSFPSPSAVINNQYAYLGCASEATAGRALNLSSLASATNMTNDLCASTCASRGLPLFGTEYGSQCYCGIALASGSQLGQDGCNMACSGSSPGPGSPFSKVPNTCGGSSRLTLWNNTLVPSPVNLASVSATAAPAGSPLSNYAYTGCYSEDRNATSGAMVRALSGASYSNAANMTVASCVQFCSGHGFGIAGLEYGAECYCGNSIGAGGARADEWTCQMQCSGNQRTWCGGSSRLSVYSARTN